MHGDGSSPRWPQPLRSPSRSRRGRDGDPASDVIISQNVFFSYTKLPESSKETLGRVVAEANRGGYTVRVALIGNRFDLGSVPVFWQKPQQYAKFLSQELLGPAPYTNRVLTVMPNGFGLSRSGKELPSERRALDAVSSADTRARTSRRRERGPSGSSPCCTASRSRRARRAAAATASGWSSSAPPSLRSPRRPARLSGAAAAPARAVRGASSPAHWKLYTRTSPFESRTP